LKAWSTSGRGGRVLALLRWINGADLLSTTVILNLLRAKPWRFVEDIAGDELPMREGDDSYVFISVNDQAYRVTARVEQMQDLEKQGYVVMQPGRWVLKAT
jgi:hypothetical protein